MIRQLACASTLICAANAIAQTPPTGARAYGAPIVTTLEADVIDGYVLAIVDGCAAAAEADKSLAQLNNPAFVPDLNRRKGFEAPPGATAWAPQPGQGAVTIDEYADSCQVATYGVPLQRTLDKVVAALLDHGYERRAAPAALPGKFDIRLAKKFEHRAIVIVVGGTEASGGSQSPYSITTAVIEVATY